MRNIRILNGAESSQNYSDLDAVVQEADRKMYESKKQYYISFPAADRSAATK